MPLGRPPATESVTVGKFLLVFRSPAGAVVVAPASATSAMGSRAVERQLHDLTLAYDGADAVALGFNGYSGVGLDRHFLGDVAGGELGIDLRVAADLQGDTALQIAFEARSHHRDGVGTEGEIRGQVLTREVGGDNAHGAGSGLRERHLCIGHDSPVASSTTPEI